MWPALRRNSPFDCGLLGVDLDISEPWVDFCSYDVRFVSLVIFPFALLVFFSFLFNKTHLPSFYPVFTQGFHFLQPLFIEHHDALKVYIKISGSCLPMLTWGLMFFVNSGLKHGNHFLSFTQEKTTHQCAHRIEFRQWRTRTFK